MLARKYYAQKGNSKGRMNTRAVAGSSSIVLNNKKRIYDSNTSKKMDEYTSKNYIDEKKYLTIKCSTSDNSTTKSVCNDKCDVKYVSQSGIRSNRVSNIHKDIVFNTQGDHIEKAKENRACIENDPKPRYSICGVSV
jgi:hypothetical protein